MTEAVPVPPPPKPGRIGGAGPRLFGAFARRSAVAGIVLVALGSGFLLGGFVRFAEEVSRFSVPSSSVGRADGIVVLTGGAMRIETAFDLLKQGAAERLLISGVNPDTSIEALANLTQTPRDWFDCCVDMDYAALNTVGNAEMAGRWAQSRGFDEIILVTSDYHMPRSLREFERFAGFERLVPYAVTRADLWVEGDAPSGTGIRVLLTEYAKLVVARVRSATGFASDPSDTAAYAALGA